MLRVDNKIKFVRLPWSPWTIFKGQYTLMSGERIYTIRWKRAAFQTIEATQQDRPVELVRDERGTLWAMHDCFYWEDEGLEADDVRALIHQRADDHGRRSANPPGLAGWRDIRRFVTDARAADVTPLSLGIVLAGAGLMLIAVFLPQFESSTFAQIEKNSLIQNGGGWYFIALAVLAAGTAYHAYRNQRRSFGAVLFGAIGIGTAFYYGTSHSQRELCSVSSVTFAQRCSLGTPGIGIYAAGVGGLLVMIGGWQIFKSELVERDMEEEDEEKEEEHLPSPDGASTIAERLRTVDQLHADGVITDAEHAQRRAELISEV